MIFGEQFQVFLDTIVQFFLSAIRIQFSEVFALLDIFQFLSGGGAV